MKKVTARIAAAIVAVTAALAFTACDWTVNLPKPLPDNGNTSIDISTATSATKPDDIKPESSTGGNSNMPAVSPVADFSEADRSTLIRPDVNGGITIERRTREKTVPMGKSGTWTIFVYLCGSDLESTDGTGCLDMSEMVKANTSKDVRFIVQTGGTKKWSDSGISSKNIQRYEICGGKMTRLANLADANMGKAETLSDFLIWGVEKYPAENMGVIMWNHGSGSIDGVCFDEKNNYDSLTLVELDKALTSVHGKMTDKFEFIGFDACLMATVETANILVPHANYMIASQQLEPGLGWDYKVLGQYISKNPTANGGQVGKAAADSFYASCAKSWEEDSCTLSVIDLSRVDELISAINKESVLLNGMADDSAALSQAIRGITSAKNFGSNNRIEGYTNMVDLGALFINSTGGSHVKTALKNAVVYNKYGVNEKGATGLSIYYPLSVESSTELSTFSEICVSPQYMTFVDRIAYGSANGGSFDDYSGGDFWLDSAGSIWDILFGFGDDSDYEYGDDGDYSYNYSENDYFDFWDSFDDEEDNNVDFGTENDNTAIINYAVEPHFNEEGRYTFTLDEESLMNAASVYCSVFMYDEETGGMLELGLDSYVEWDWENGVFTDKFGGIWFGLPDGQFLSMTLIEEPYGYYFYTAPILLNGEFTFLRVKLDYTSGKDVITILGTWDGITENGQTDKGIRKLKKGDKITPVYYYYNSDGYYESDTYGFEYTYTGDDSIEYFYLSESEYLYSFAILDIFGNMHYTDYVSFYVDEDGEIYYYD